MRYVIEIPDDITQALEQRASASGGEVVDLIEEAVVSFIRNDAEAVSIGRRPDAPLRPLESVAPCDLPRGPSRAIPIQQTSQRIPDPIAAIT